MEHSTHSRPADAPSPDTIRSLLSDRRRRAVVDVLSERRSPIAVRELAAAVRSREPESESDDGSAGSIDEIAAALHHVHLPPLDDADVVDYDAETTVVTPVETEVLAPFLGTPDDGG